MTQDPLNRPLPEHLVEKSGLAGDLILATSSSRFFAFIIDFCLIMILFITSICLLENHILALNHWLLFYLIWGAYCVIFATNKTSATIGQKIFHIHLYSLFTPKITMANAVARFILMSYPFAFFLYLGNDLLVDILIFAGLSQQNVTNKFDGSANYSLILIAIFLQLFNSWPFISGNLRNVSWDKTFRCCVIKQRIK